MRGKNPDPTENHPEDIYVFKASRKHNGPVVYYILILLKLLQ